MTTGTPASDGALPNPSAAQGPEAVTTFDVSCARAGAPRSRRPTSTWAPPGAPGYPGATLSRSPTTPLVFPITAFWLTTR